MVGENLDGIQCGVWRFGPEYAGQGSPVPKVIGVLRAGLNSVLLIQEKMDSPGDASHMGMPGIHPTIDKSDFGTRRDMLTLILTHTPFPREESIANVTDYAKKIMLSAIGIAVPLQLWISV